MTEGIQLSLLAPHPPERDTDFYLFRNLKEKWPWRWEGTGSYADRKSDRAFKTERLAMIDAQKALKEKRT